MGKKYGYIIGRFSPVTKGHEKLIEYALTKVDVLLILVGSADKKNTFRNPFSIETRMRLLTKIYKKEIENKQIILAPLNDLTEETDIQGGKWGKYLIQNVEKILKIKPDYSIYGEEESRKYWFNKEDVINIEDIILKRTEEDISATKVREIIAKNDYENFKKFVNSKIYEDYNDIRNELLKTKEYLEISRGR